MNANPVPEPPPDKETQREFAQATFRVVPHAGPKRITIRDTPRRRWWPLFAQRTRKCKHCGAVPDFSHLWDGCPTND